MGLVRSAVPAVTTDTALRLRREVNRMPETYRLYGAKGGGSMIVEAAFAIAHVPVKVVDLDWEDLGWESKILKPLNPLGQVPTMVMPDGTPLTESAAILLHLADKVSGSGLAPAADHPERPVFLRYLILLVSAIYPTFTYGDAPKRWLDGDEKAAKKRSHAWHEEMTGAAAKRS